MLSTWSRRGKKARNLQNKRYGIDELTRNRKIFQEGLLSIVFAIMIEFISKYFKFILI